MRIKNGIKRMISFVLVLLVTFSCVACVPKAYRKGVDVDRDFPDDILPVYEDAIVFEYINKDDEKFELDAGTKDDLKDVVDFYVDYFKDEGIVPGKEKDKKTKYQAQGTWSGVEYKLTVKQPSSKWEKKRYKTVIEIQIEGKSNGKRQAQSVTLSFDPVDISENAEAKEMLMLMQGNLDLIDDFVIDASDETEMSIEETMAIIDAYQQKIATQVEQMKERELNETELIYLQDSEITLFGIAADILDETEQIVNYGTEVTEIFARMNTTISKGQNGSLVDLYTAINAGFDQCAEEMAGVEAPSFMLSQHNRLLEKMDELYVVASDMLWAVDIQDSLRVSNYAYFMNYYLRYFDAFGMALDADVENRLEKFEEDIAYIDTWSKDLDHFITNTINTDTLDLMLYNSDYLVQTQQVMVSYVLDTPEEIVPANYRSMDYVAFLQLWTNKDTTDVMVTVEIPEYTQVYQEKVTITRAETEIAILPPLLADISEKLKTSKDAQLKITVEDTNTGELVLQETKPIKLYSIYDMRWGSGDGIPYYENILAWVTPENDQVLTLLRNAADSVETITEGQIDFIGGYQGAFGDFSEADVTYYQTVAIMNAMADAMNVKYINAAFSTTDNNLQRIATPERVLDNASGLCIETAVTLASAIRAAGMDAMILLLPGHAQVAVETSHGSGEYYLIETTALDAFKNLQTDGVAVYLTKAEWQTYIDERQVIAIDCSMASLLNIHPID